MPKDTNRLHKYCTRRIGLHKYKDYFAISVPPSFYIDFQEKEMYCLQAGSSLIYTITGCLPLTAGSILLK